MEVGVAVLLISVNFREQQKYQFKQVCIKCSFCISGVHLLPKKPRDNSEHAALSCWQEIWCVQLLGISRTYLWLNSILIWKLSWLENVKSFACWRRRSRRWDACAGLGTSTGAMIYSHVWAFLLYTRMSPFHAWAFPVVFFPSFTFGLFDSERESSLIDKRTKDSSQSRSNMCLFSWTQTDNFAKTESFYFSPAVSQWLALKKCLFMNWKTAVCPIVTPNN
jgi:hypothetical protein